MIKKIIVIFLCLNSVKSYKNRTYDEDIFPFLNVLENVRQFIGNFIPLNEKTIKSLTSLAVSATDRLLPVKPLPHLNEHIWWGDDHGHYAPDTSIRPFEIEFDEQNVQNLLKKLHERENFTLPLKNAAFTYGMNTKFLDRILDYWSTKYNFKERANRLNIYPQFKTNIQGLDIHFYHIKPKTEKRLVPLLMLHGAPVSNMEYIYLFPRLLADRHDCDFAFEIIAPTIPGFGYSEGTSKIGFNTYQIAIILKNFMKRLGSDKFYIHAGDVGQVIAADMVTLYPDIVLGFHTNFPYSFRPRTFVKYAIGSLYPTAVVKPKYVDRLYPIFRRIYFILRDFGYFHMHATKPDTLGVGLQDSPSGLASWILTGMSWAANPNNDLLNDGGLPNFYDLEDLLDVLTILWDSKSITTGIRLYAEFSAWFQDPKQLQILITPTKTPYACIKFRHEIIYQPDDFLKDKYPNLVYSRTLDFGGHYAAFENPDVLAEDIWAAVQKMIKFNLHKYHKDKENGHSYGESNVVDEF